MASGPVGGQITDLAVASEGYLWLAADGRLVRFDGNHFRTFNSETHAALEAPVVRRVYVSSSGGLIVGLAGGQGVLRRVTATDGEKWQQLTLPTDLDVTALNQTAGALYVGTNQGLYVAKQGRDVLSPEAPHILKNRVVTALLPTSGNVTWIGTDKGLWRKTSSSLRRIGASSASAMSEKTAPAASGSPSASDWPLLSEATIASS